MVSHEELKQLIHYDPVKGIVTWKISPCRNIKVGSRAGSVHLSRGKKYRSITIKGLSKREHCWIWYLVTGVYPDNQIDHLNGDGTDNRWSNIRKVSINTNRHNHRRYSSNKSGITGVFWSKGKNTWFISFYLPDGCRLRKERKDFFEACCLRKSLENKYGYSKQHGSNRPY